MSDRVFWRCSRRECKATAVTVGGRVEHVRILHTHKPPTPGEFFSSSATATATTTTTTTEPISRLDMSARSNPTGRVRRRSHQQQQRQQQLQHQTVKSLRSSRMLLNDARGTEAVDRAGKLGMTAELLKRTVFKRANQQQQLPQLVSPGSLSQEGLKSTPISTKSTVGASVHLPTRLLISRSATLKNSTPDPPFEASGSSTLLSQATPANHLLSPLIPSESGHCRCNHSVGSVRSYGSAWSLRSPTGWK
ncbi:hypothetical protein ECG_03382 [Echinococcus granulosus]|nr:hypothetical protein ECG_03382 [Echinococcus granulosus]